MEAANSLSNGRGGLIVRHFRRPSLPDTVHKALDKESLVVAEAIVSRHDWSATKHWKVRRGSRLILSVLSVLRHMAGERYRCMYCGDSHGTDIEHFWPKSPFPLKMFDWMNLLLCCTDCGRIKGDRFPIRGKIALMIDPTVDEPWNHLDFDPMTGNIVPRYDIDGQCWDERGSQTVEVLQLDQREALSASLRKSHSRLKRQALHSIETGDVSLDGFLLADDTGLLEWCLFGTGASTEPFLSLIRKHPALKTEYKKKFRSDE